MAKAEKAAKTPEKNSGLDELIEMDEAIGMCKTSRSTFYRWLRSGKIQGVKAGRQWRFKRSEITRFLEGGEPAIELRADIKPLINNLNSKLSEHGIKDDSSYDNDVIAAAAAMIRLGTALKASDIHIESQWDQDTGSGIGLLRYRVDGMLVSPVTIDMRLVPPIIERWKLMAACDVHERIKPQDGRILVSFDGENYDLRVNFLPACLGETVTARILYPGHDSLSLAQVDYAPGIREQLDHALAAPAGMIVFAGPWGSGTTTVLYACLKELAVPERKVISVENPVELFLPGITQVQINPGKGITFPYVLRAALRAAPNVISIGATRDSETLVMAQHSALSGHLVTTVMESTSAARTIRKMMDMSEEPFLVADSVKLIIGQRLVRLLCPECARKADPDPDILQKLKDTIPGLQSGDLEGGFREPAGCAHCHNTGFRGRAVLAEALELTPRVQSVIRKDGSSEDIEGAAAADGMVPMAKDGLRRAAAGETSLNEIVRVLGIR